MKGSPEQFTRIPPVPLLDIYCITEVGITNYGKTHSPI